MTMIAARPSARGSGATNSPSIFAMVKSSFWGGLFSIGLFSRRELSTPLTDRDDRQKLSALALVAAGLLVAMLFIWVRLVTGMSSLPGYVPAAAANHAAAAPRAPAAVAE